MGTLGKLSTDQAGTLQDCRIHAGQDTRELGNYMAVFPGFLALHAIVPWLLFPIFSGKNHRHDRERRAGRSGRRSGGTPRSAGHVPTSTCAIRRDRPQDAPRPRVTQLEDEEYAALTANAGWHSHDELFEDIQRLSVRVPSPGSDTARGPFRVLRLTYAHLRSTF